MLYNTLAHLGGAAEVSRQVHLLPGLVSVGEPRLGELDEVLHHPSLEQKKDLCTVQTVHVYCPVPGK